MHHDRANPTFIHPDLEGKLQWLHFESIKKVGIIGAGTWAAYCHELRQRRLPGHWLDVNGEMLGKRGWSISPSVYKRSVAQERFDDCRSFRPRLRPHHHHSGLCLRCRIWILVFEARI